jgi:uncharacterized protein DUF1918
MPAKKAIAKKKPTAKKRTVAKKPTAAKKRVAAAKKPTAAKKRVAAKKPTIRKNAPAKKTATSRKPTTKRISATTSRRVAKATARPPGPDDPARPGDLIIIDSPQVGSAPREGEVLQVVHGEVSVSYRVKWRDGHETLIAPKSGAARIVRAGA